MLIEFVWNPVRVALVGSMLASMTGCMTPAPPKVGPKHLEFQCLPIPSDFKEVGSIFAVDKKGVSTRIGNVDTVPKADVKESKAGIPKFTSNSNFKVGFLISTLEELTASTGWNAKVSAEASNNVDVVTSYDGTSYKLIEGQPEQLAISWFQSKKYRVESGHSYYFVREAILATEVDYEIKRGDIGKLGGEAQVRSMVAGKLDVLEKKINDSYTLKAKFLSPVNVCIKPIELVIKSSSATGPQILGTADVKGSISITAVQ